MKFISEKIQNAVRKQMLKKYKEVA